MRNIILLILWFMTINNVHCSSKNKLDLTEFTWKTESGYNFLNDLYSPFLDISAESFFANINIIEDSISKENPAQNLLETVKQEENDIFSNLFPIIKAEKEVTSPKLSSSLTDLVSEDESTLGKAHIELLIPDDFTLSKEIIIQNQNNEQVTDQENNLFLKETDFINNKRKERDEEPLLKKTKKVKINKRGRKVGSCKKSISKNVYKEITVLSLKNINTLRYKTKFLDSINEKEFKKGTLCAAHSQIRYILKALFMIKDDSKIDQRARKNALLILEAISDMPIDTNQIKIKKKPKKNKKPTELKNTLVAYLLDQELSLNTKNDYLHRMLNHLKKIVLYFDISGLE